MSTSSPYAVWYVLRRFSSSGLLRAAPRRDSAKKMHRYSFMATASMLCRRRGLLFQSAGDSSLVTDHTVSEYATEEGRLRRRLQSAELPLPLYSPLQPTSGLPMYEIGYQRARALHRNVPCPGAGHDFP